MSTTSTFETSITGLLGKMSQESCMKSTGIAVGPKGPGSDDHSKFSPRFLRASRLFFPGGYASIFCFIKFKLLPSKEFVIEVHGPHSHSSFLSNVKSQAFPALMLFQSVILSQFDEVQSVGKLQSSRQIM